MSTIISLVSRDPQLVQLMRDTGMPCVTVSQEALAGLAQPGASQPGLLVIDLRDEPHVPPALASLKRQHPTTGVLLVASKLDPELMLEAMRSGVNEFVTFPVAVPELQAAIKRLVGNLSSTARGDVFAFVGAKGGIGTTTVAVNVATALAKLAPEATLLIDLNIACGDAAVFLGSEPRFSVMDALENVQRLDAAFFGGLVTRTKAGLDLLGASGRAVTPHFDAIRMRTLLDFAAQTRQFTVLDVPRSDSTALDSLESATKIFLVANQELATVRNASRMAASLRQRYSQARLSLVVTRTDRRAEIGFDDVERTVGVDISNTFPSDYRSAVQAMNKGRPIVLDATTELAKSFTAFARGLAGAPSEKDQRQRSTTLFGRLSPRKA